MYDFDSVEFIRAVAALNGLWAILHDQSRQGRGSEIVEIGLSAYLKVLRDIRKGAAALGSPATVLPSDRLIDRLESRKPINIGEFKEMAAQIIPRLADDFTGRKVLLLSQIEGEYFDPPSPSFGIEVVEKFPTVIYDIEEASKCLALERSTAAAFHAIRSLEAAIRAIARCLQIPDPTKGGERSWNRALGSIKDKMDQKWPVSGRLSGDGRLFEELHAVLAAMQNPYRNATMHLDQKYTQEEALHIFKSVGILMKKLASRCDEEGKPWA